MVGARLRKGSGTRLPNPASGRESAPSAGAASAAVSEPRGLRNAGVATEDDEDICAILRLQVLRAHIRPGRMQSAQSAFATVQLPGVHDSLRRSASARVHETLVWDEAVFEYDIRRSLLLVPASKSSGDEAEPADDGAPVERDEATRTWKRFGSGPGRLSHSASRYLRSGAAAGAKAVPRPMRLGLRRGRKSLMGWSSSTAATAPAAEEPDPIGEMVLSQRAISTLEAVSYTHLRAHET